MEQPNTTTAGVTTTTTTITIPTINTNNATTNTAKPLSYYGAKYSEACEKLVDKAVDEMDFKTLLKCFDLRNLNQYEEQILHSFCRQFADYYRKGIQDEIMKVNQKYNIDNVMHQIFDLKQRQTVLGVINSAQLNQDVNGQSSALELEKNFYQTIKDNVKIIKDLNMSHIAQFTEPKP